MLRGRSLPWLVAVSSFALLVLTGAACSSGRAPSTEQTPVTNAPAAGGAVGQPSGATGATPVVLPARPGPLTGALAEGRAYTVGATGRNANIELSVTNLEITKSLADTGAPPGHQFIVLTTTWKNLVPPKQVQRPKSQGRGGMLGGGEVETVTVEVPYLVQNVPDNLYLLVDGPHVAEISQASEQLPDHLPLSGLVLERYNAQVQGRVAFSVPEGAHQNLTLQFFDFSQGHITLLLQGTWSPAREKALAGPLRNQLFEVTIYRTQFARALGGTNAPAGLQYLVIDCGASSTTPGAATQIDVDQYAFLIEDGVYQSQPLKEVRPIPYLFQGLVRAIPQFERRGVMVFQVPEQSGRLELLFSASQMDPLRFVLTPDRLARPQPQPAGSIQDGNAIEVLLNRWTWLDRIGNVSPAGGSRFLVLDVTMVNRGAGPGLTVEPRQFAVLDAGQVIDASPATSALAHPLTGERAVSAGTRRRFEVAFEVPQAASGLRLRYSGYTKIEDVAIR